jgi:hypothetical protein
MMRKCPYCAEEVHADAVKCKHCGSALERFDPKTATWLEKGQYYASKLMGDKRESKAEKWLGWIGALVVLLVIVLAGRYVDQPDTSTPTAATQEASASAPPIETFTARELYAMFHANEVRANERVGAARVQFTGIVTQIQQSDFSATPEIDISADDGNEFDSFRADLKTSELSQAAALVKGQKITLLCDHVSMPIDVYAKGCVIVPVDSNTAH